MVDPKNIDFNQLPKKFCDGALGAFNKDAIMFCITSGSSLEPYATTPQIAKNIAMFFSQQIDKYEEEFGKIDSTVPSIRSPLQASDLDTS
ncbi:MAG: hypothetical protein KBB88_00010 [Candidatus Pacebacteria bacterium]|nr:hypothetical protein [Candidatus Paceibacterota bacterium]